jgi:hypothetical protein
VKRRPARAPCGNRHALHLPMCRRAHRLNAKRSSSHREQRALPTTSTPPLAAQRSRPTRMPPRPPSAKPTPGATAPAPPADNINRSISNNATLGEYACPPPDPHPPLVLRPMLRPIRAPPRGVRGHHLNPLARPRLRPVPRITHDLRQRPSGGPRLRIRVQRLDLLEGLGHHLLGLLDLRSQHALERTRCRLHDGRIFRIQKPQQPRERSRRAPPTRPPRRPPASVKPPSAAAATVRRLSSPAMASRTSAPSPSSLHAISRAAAAVRGCTASVIASSVASRTRGSSCARPRSIARSNPHMTSRAQGRQREREHPRVLLFDQRIQLVLREPLARRQHLDPDRTAGVIRGRTERPHHERHERVRRELHRGHEGVGDHWIRRAKR